MELHGISNDAIQALNPVACIILGPVIQNIFYPILNKLKVSFGPISRMALSFITMAATMAYAAGVQRLVYNTGPCFKAPLNCPASNGGNIPNAVNIWIQTPVYFLFGSAEIFGFVSLSEYSYTKAPKNMRTVVQALRLVTVCIGSALGMALSPVAVDPKLVYMYAGLAAAILTSTPLFWAYFYKYDKMDKALNSLDMEEAKKKDKKTQEA
jgi:proton-dependent oligopeptide transporter, POT family